MICKKNINKTSSIEPAEAWGVWEEEEGEISGGLEIVFVMAINIFSLNYKSSSLILYVHMCCEKNKQLLSSCEGEQSIMEEK